MLLLYLLTYIQLNGQYGQALSSAREAAFIQSGIKSDYDVARKAATKKVPKELYWAGSVGVMVYKKEVRFKTRDYGHYQINNQKVLVTWGVSW